MSKIKLLSCLAALVAFAGPLAAQDVDPEMGAEMGLGAGTQSAGRVTPVTYQNIDLSKNVILKYDVRLGAVVKPAYFGSDEYVLGPDFALHFDYARLKGLPEYGTLDPNAKPSAIGLRGSLRFISARNSDDYEAINGLEDIPASLELGLGVVYRQRNFEAFADARYAVVGHNSYAGEVGMDGIGYPSEKWELRVGPRFTWGGNGFAETYFGVTDEEAAASGMAPYTATGGLLGVGVEASARYRFNDLWGLEAAVRGDRLLNSAADSPITERGSADQFRIRLGITRELVLQF